MVEGLHGASAAWLPALVLFGFLALRSLLRDLWRLAALTVLPARQRLAQWLVTGVLVAVAIAGAVFFGVRATGPLNFLVLAVVPTVAWSLLRWTAWWRDPVDVRAAALDVAIERADRLNLPRPTLTQRWPWPEYLFDVEAASRRRAYQPPPID
jgi:hypothetical protein